MIAINSSKDALETMSKAAGAQESNRRYLKFFQNCANPSFLRKDKAGANAADLVYLECVLV
jgi:hypothetical protein